MAFTRITVDAKQMGDVPCIRGLRIPVATVVGIVADEMPEAGVLAAYPDLEREDIREALRYAAAAVRASRPKFIEKRHPYFNSSEYGQPQRARASASAS